MKDYNIFQKERKKKRISKNSEKERNEKESEKKK